MMTMLTRILMELMVQLKPTSSFSSAVKPGTATPMGLNTIVFPAAYGGDTETGASMAMISHTLSVVTIPLMYLVFVVLL